MQFIDLKSQYQSIKEDMDKRIHAVLDHGRYIGGPEIQQFEQQMADYCGAKHCIGVGSGTDALLVSEMALGIKPGDEVITTPFTFMATASTLALLGAKIVFVDIDPKTYNIDPNQIEDAITERTKLILPVSLYGQCADMDAINAMADKYNIPVLEDAAQSFGATYKGKHSCNLSTVAITSLYPPKPLGAYGEAGACFTNDDKLAEIMLQIRDHGQAGRYNHVRLGLNARLDTIQAATALSKLQIFTKELRLRRQVAELYTHLLKNHVPTPLIESHNTSSYAQYTIQVDNRDELQAKLKEAEIPTAVHYPIPLHKQPVFEKEYGDSNCPIAEEVAQKVLSLPMHPYMDHDTITTVANAVIENI